MAGRRGFALRVLRRLRPFLLVFVGVYAAAAIGFYLLQGNVGLLNSFYWAMVTISTIGYGDITPTNPTSRVFTIGVAATQIFLLGYLISIVSAVVTEESQHRALGTLGTDFEGHIVVLGDGAVGKAAIRELLLQEEQVAVVCADAGDVANLKTLAPDGQLFVTYGPAADRQILERVNLTKAHSVIVCTPDDTSSLIAALNARAMAPKLRIVVSVTRPELRETLRAAGVTYVASPGDMGGRLCADAAFRPDVANSIEDLTTVTYGADITEYMLSEKTPISAQTIEEAERLVRAATNCIVLGYARPQGAEEFTTVLNPPVSDRLQPGYAIIVMGSLENLAKLHRWFGTRQGR